MSVQERMIICRLLERMNEQEAYGEKIGLENVSRFHGKQIVNYSEAGRKNK